MSVDLRDLYQEIILDHSRSPRNSGCLERPSGEARGDNPLCGDRITVQVRVEDERVVDIRFEARGCAISIASASMMTELIKGRNVTEARTAFEDFIARVTGSDGDDGLGELSALMGVRKFPARVKCATLPWHTFDAALQGGGEVTTE